MGIRSAMRPQFRDLPDEDPLTSCVNVLVRPRRSPA
jgi:hypothetical protein